MSRHVRTLGADADVAAVVEQFLHTPHRRFPVLEGTHLVGILSRHDLLRALQELW
jgi:CBS domain-containing protein